MLHEKYRPKDWPDVIGQDKITAMFAGLEAAGKLAGKAYLITGKSGVGKSTIARIIASKVSDIHHRAEFTPGELTAYTVAHIKEQMHYAPMTCAAYAYIVNEVHKLRTDAVTALLDILEEPYLGPHVVWIFTTTLDGLEAFEGEKMDAGPFRGRCLPIQLAQRDIADVAAARLLEIHTLEGGTPKPHAWYKKLFYSSGSSIREAISKLETHLLYDATGNGACVSLAGAV